MFNTLQKIPHLLREEMDRYRENGFGGAYRIDFIGKATTGLPVTAIEYQQVLEEVRFVKNGQSKVVTRYVFVLMLL